MAKKKSLKVPDDCSCWQEGDTNCRCCGASLVMPVHSLTRGLAETLVTLAYEARRQGGYEVDYGELKLSHNQLSNFQKLRYFGLLVKKVNDDGVHVPRHWIITRRGWQFLAGETQVFKQARSFRNRVVHWDETEQLDIPMITIDDVLGTKDDPYWQSKADFIGIAREYANPQARLL